LKAHILKPGYYISDSRVETGRFQAMGQLGFKLFISPPHREGDVGVLAVEDAHHGHLIGGAALSWRLLANGRRRGRSLANGRRDHLRSSLHAALVPHPALGVQHAVVLPPRCSAAGCI
jgi:hypothetical protein